jgi:hypothetical protein
VRKAHFPIACRSQLIASGALKLWPFSVGMALTLLVGILLAIVMARWRTLEYIWIRS